MFTVENLEDETAKFESSFQETLGHQFGVKLKLTQIEAKQEPRTEELREQKSRVQQDKF